MQHGTSVNDSRNAVLDILFWWSKTDQMAIQGVESFPPPDPRLDHDLLQARLSCDTLGSMPPLKALRAPMRLRMRSWGQKKAEWRETATLSLVMSAPEADKFMELERSQ